jgi:hypothetical protein
MNDPFGKAINCISGVYDGVSIHSNGTSTKLPSALTQRRTS